MDEQLKAWRNLHQQRIKRISSLEHYGNQYKQYLTGQCSKDHLSSSKNNGLRIYPADVIQWVEIFGELDAFYEVESRQVSVEGRRLFSERYKYLFREKYKSVSFSDREDHHLKSFCEHFSRYSALLLYNKHRKLYASSGKGELLSVKMASVMAEQSFQQKLLVVPNASIENSFHYRIKQFIWLIANMIMISNQEGVLELSSNWQMLKDMRNDKITPFLRYAVELKIDGYHVSSIATKLELKFLEIVKDSSHSDEDLKLAYLIKEAQQGFCYGKGNNFWRLCCDLGALSRTELRQVYHFLVAAGILAEDEYSEDTNNFVI